MMDQPDVRYCMTEDGVRLAYYVMGEGPPLVRAAGFPSHLTAMWSRPDVPESMRELADEHLVVAYDPRGMGLSQRVHDFTLDTRVADMRTIVRHLKLDRFALTAQIHATVAAAAYAARYPDEVSHLVLVSPYADGPQLYASSSAFAAYAALESVTTEQWDFVAMTIASRGSGYGDAAAARFGADYIKASITAEGYIAYRRDNRLTSVRDELGAITASTLVIGRENDDVIPAELAQEVAARIPNARFQLLPPSLAMSVDGGVNELLLDFIRPPGQRKPVRETPAASPGTKAAHFTAVILFTDIVSSTELTERMGDARFRDASRALDAGLRTAIGEAGGEAIEGKLLGDGVLATFPSAAQAIDGARRCLALSAASEFGLHIGLHAGDVIREEGNVFGGAVNIAARICGLSAPGEILVSDVVRGMARSSAGVVFEDRGEHEMKGVSEPVRVYTVRWKE
jgi:class 3 adenylate cyclase/alpha-beta hydrolase superfamily lysophospholipase